MSTSAAPPDCSPITLSPVPGFAVKSIILTGSTIAPSSSTSFLTTSSSSAPSNIISSSSKTTLDDLNDAANAQNVAMPSGMKVFVNVCWETSGAMPAPPDLSEAAVKRAMQGEDDDVNVGDGKGVYYVPVAVTGPREDRDKAGKPSLVFDCIFSSKIKSRCTKDPDFKTYIIELALERIEEKTSIELSRQIGTPNIASKGKLLPRTVYIPNVLLRVDQKVSVNAPSVPSSSKTQALSSKKPAKTTDTSKPKSILKGSSSSTAAEPKRPLIEEVSSSENTLTADDAALLEERKTLERNIAALPQPRWQWTMDGESVKFMVDVPKLTRNAHLSSSLNVEERRLLLLIPGIYGLDINLDLSDAQIGKIDSVAIPPESYSQADASSSKGKKTDDAGTLAEEFNVRMNLDAEQMRVRGRNAGEALRLKKWMDSGKGRELNVEDARAEWYTLAGKMAVWA